MCISLETGAFPDLLKTSCVVPVHKKGDKSQLSNYRPISLLSSFSKLFEYCFLNILLPFLEKNNILCGNQHGFRAGKSTETALTAFCDEVRQLIDAGECPAGIFCDLSRAFECVEHGRLVSKLESYGLRGVAGRWIVSYLLERRQYVSVKQIRSNHLQYYASDLLNVLTGVPQGSVLGPILFLLYINDLGKYVDCNGSTVTLYADDASFLISGESQMLLKSRCNSALERAAEWFASNSLYLNGNKTTMVQFHSYQKRINQPLQVGTGQWVVSPSHSVRFLGLYVDENLNFRDHCTHLMSKLSSAHYQLRSLRNVFTSSQMMPIYFANVESRLRYGIAFWGLSVLAERVFVSQKKIVRCLAGIHDNTFSCRQLFREFGLLTLTGIFIFEVSLKIFPQKCSFFTGSNLHQYNTRRKQNYRVPFRRLLVGQKATDNIGLRVFNHLPTQITSIAGLPKFKKALREFLVARCFYSIGEFFDGDFR